jgi:hypothetical protein
MVYTMGTTHVFVKAVWSRRLILFPRPYEILVFTEKEIKALTVSDLEVVIYERKLNRLFGVER